MTLLAHAILAAAVAAAQAVPQDKPEESGALFPFVLPWDDASAGLTNMSAAVSGTVVARDGRFYAGDRRIRFLGVNLCYGANFPRPEDAPKIAARMARFGINVVRFHHMDGEAYPRGIRAKGKTSGELSDEALGRLDAFIAALKQQGIYTNLNLLVSRPFRGADGLDPAIEKISSWKERHGVGFFHAPLLDLQKDFARRLLTHRNPHTGLTYAEDPAVAFVEINNENGLFNNWLMSQLDRLPEPFRVDLENQWHDWLRRRPGAQTGPLPPLVEFKKRMEQTAQVRSDWVRFLWETEDRYWQEMRRFLEADVKVRGIVMGTIIACSTPNLMASFPATDTHAYWQHPKFPRRQWDPEDWIVENRTMVNEPGGVLPDLALRRVLGKPHCVTEYNAPAPMTYGGETYLLLAAYAALQDWDAIYAFTYSHRGETEWDPRRITGFFDIDSHPTKMVTLIPAAAMFLRGDVRPAEQLVAGAVGREQEIERLGKTHPWHLVSAEHGGVTPRTALVHRVAVATEGSRGSGSPVAADAGPIDSDTGELRWDLTKKGRGVVTVNAPRSKAVIGFGAGLTYALGEVVIEPGPSLQDGWSAITATEMGPSRWLVTATGLTQNTGQVWKDAKKNSLGKNWGEAPVLVEGIRATITFPFPAAGHGAWALDPRGQRGAPVPLRADPQGRAILTLDPSARTLWYEVAPGAP